MINELNAQLEDSKSNEKELSEALEQSKVEFRVKEENFLKQIKGLQQVPLPYFVNSRNWKFAKTL